MHIGLVVYNPHYVYAIFYNINILLYVHDVSFYADICAIESPHADCAQKNPSSSAVLLSKAF